MAASDSLNYEQLAMFMPARQLMNRVGASIDTVGTESMDDLWKRKLEESKLPEGTQYPNPYKGGFMNANSGDFTTLGTGVYDSMRAKGYQGQPLEVSHIGGANGDPNQRNLMLPDGHHRLAVAADLDLLVPVDHRDSASDQATYRRNNPDAPKPDPRLTEAV